MAAKKTVHEKVIREVIEKPVKKKTKKKSAKKKRKTTRKKPNSKSASNEKIEKALIENFISLQKVMVNLSVKFDGLSTQISKLLELFEISAKALAEKEFVTDKEKKDNRDVLEKMDEIIDQNKVLARGMTLMHDRISEQEEMPFTQPSPMPPQPRPPIPKPLPQLPLLPKPRITMEAGAAQRPMVKPVTPPMPEQSMSQQPEPNPEMKPLPSREMSNEGYERSISSNNNDANKRQSP